jgi:multiple sugar transport system permease protein
MIQAQTPARPASGRTPSRVLLTLSRTVSYLALTLLVILCLIPFVWMVLTALKPENEVMTNPPRWLPSALAWSNFPRAFSFYPFGRFVWNTLLVAVAATVLQTVVAVLAAYAFARLRFPGRNVLFMAYLGTLMIPQQVTIVPLFLMMRAANLADTYWALILPSAFHAFGVFLMRQFLLTLPRELEESAYIDGASRIRVLWQVLLPLSRPALATLVLFTFIREWNAFLWPLIATRTLEMRTVAVGLTLFTGQYGTEWHLLMAAATVTILPSLIIFALAQRYYIEGIALSGFGGR